MVCAGYDESGKNFRSIGNARRLSATIVHTGPRTGSWFGVRCDENVFLGMDVVAKL